MEEKIGGRIGWSREKVQKTVTLCSRIPPQILVLAKTFQKGRGGCFPPNGGINDHSANAPKNERSVTLRSKIGTEILVFGKSFQSGRVPNFGTNVPKNERSVTLRSKIGTEILVFAKSFQSGRVPDFGTNVPKNERYITFKNWRRDSDFGKNLSGWPCAKHSSLRRCS